MDSPNVKNKIILESTESLKTLNKEGGNLNTQKKGGLIYEALTEEFDHASSLSNESIETVSHKNCKRDYHIGHVTEAPHFSKDNEFILNGYRINFHSCKKIFHSLCMCHNETVNVWTHLVGALFTVLLILITAISTGPYGSRLNSLQNFESLRNNITFTNYSTPYYNSKPIFHNNRLILSTLLKYLNDDKKIISEKINNKFKSNLEKGVKDLEKVNTLVIKNSQIKCFSCVEDFVRNIFSLLVLVKDFNQTIYEKILESSLTDNIKNVGKKLNGIIENLKTNNKNYDFDKIGYYNKESVENDQVNLPKWPITIQLLCAIVCLSCSSFFHLFTAYGDKVSAVLARLDYGGISILIAGSCYPPYYYMYYCSSLYLYVYLSFISIFALTVFFVSLYPSFAHARNRKFRGTLFLILGISAGIPIIHIVILNDPVIGMLEHPSVALWGLGGLTYISGCLIYINRFPEKKFPGVFDLIGSSHQIWHIFVLTGIILHHFASINSYYDRLNNECPAL